jgi:hypothetical protein
MPANLMEESFAIMLLQNLCRRLGCSWKGISILSVLEVFISLKTPRRT